MSWTLRGRRPCDRHPHDPAEKGLTKRRPSNVLLKPQHLLHRSSTHRLTIAAPCHGLWNGCGYGIGPNRDSAHPACSVVIRPLGPQHWHWTHKEGGDPCWARLAKATSSGTRTNRRPRILALLLIQSPVLASMPQCMSSSAQFGLQTLYFAG